MNVAFLLYVLGAVVIFMLLMAHQLHLVPLGKVSTEWCSAGRRGEMKEMKEIKEEACRVKDISSRGKEG